MQKCWQGKDGRNGTDLQRLLQIGGARLLALEPLAQLRVDLTLLLEQAVQLVVHAPSGQRAYAPSQWMLVLWSPE